MFCNNCGRQIEEGSKFCNACGQPVEEPTSAQVTSSPSQTPEPQPPPPQRKSSGFPRPLKWALIVEPYFVGPAGLRVDSEAKPDKIFAQVYTLHGNIMVDFLQLGTRHPVLDLELDPGDYHVRLEGQWQYNDTSNYIERRYNTVGYVFGLRVPGAVELIAECSATEVGGDVRIVLNSLGDQLRTAVDRVNHAGCRFNKPIAHISLKLDSDVSVTYTETFHVDPPSLAVSFPLSNGLASETTGGPLSPGEYSRRMVAITANGEEWEITSYNDFLKTVTISGY